MIAKVISESDEHEGEHDHDAERLNAELVEAAGVDQSALTEGVVRRPGRGA